MVYQIYDNVIALIRHKGNRLDELRLRRALGQPFTQAEAESILAPYRFLDGSWDYSTPEEQPERIGSLGGTIHCLRWLREFGWGEGPQMTRTKEDTLIDRFYFTAAVPMRLFSLGHGEHPIVKPAIRWLALHWDDWRLVTGTWYNLWALSCIYSKSPKLSLALYQRCYATALDWLPDLEAQPLTWLLDALHGAGFPSDEPLIAKGTARLLALQRKDGAWQAPDDSTLETTVTALRLLYDY